MSFLKQIHNQNRWLLLLVVLIPCLFAGTSNRAEAQPITGDNQEINSGSPFIKIKDTGGGDFDFFHFIPDTNYLNLYTSRLAVAGVAGLATIKTAGTSLTLVLFQWDPLSFRQPSYRSTWV